MISAFSSSWERGFSAILARLEEFLMLTKPCFERSWSWPFLLVGAISFVLSSRQVAAYPTFISYGYTTCIVCHFNPFGNGPLTDYGRALAASPISAKPFFAADLSDEEYAKQSGFFGARQLPNFLTDFLRLSADYRGLYYVRGVGSDSAVSGFINMQAEGSVVLKFNEDKFVATGTFGYIPTRSSKEPKIVSREHYVSYAVTRKTRVSVGFQDVAYGIRHSDHTAVNRSIPKLGQNDQVHGVTLHYGDKNLFVGAHGFAGNLFQSSEVRPVGASLTGEYRLAEKLMLGASSLYSSSTVRGRTMGAVHLRSGFAEGAGVLIEAGLLRDKPHQAEENPLASYLFTQSHLRLTRGLNFLFNVEYSSLNQFAQSPRVFRLGPSLQYFAMSRVELRADFFGTYVIAQTQPNASPNSFLFMAQLHLWL